MITTEEFQRQYHHFRTPDQDRVMEALREVECEEPVVAVKIGAEYCLMLQKSAEYLARMGLAAEMWVP